MSYASFDPNATSDSKSGEKYREWELQPQNEYRFELAPDSSIGIKVRGCLALRRALETYLADESAPISSWMAMLNVLEQNSPSGYRICSGESAKPSYTPIVDAHWR